MSTRRNVVVGMYHAGAAIGQIARAIGCTESGVHYHLKCVGLGFNRTTFKPRTCDQASRLIRGIRYATGQVEAVDAEHVAACLHARGVPLDDLETHLGVPQAVAVEAIRRYARPLEPA